MASFYSINGTELFVVLSAAWFHDCGHLFGSAIDHEQRGVLKMQEYMEHSEVEPQIIEEIRSCILATRLPGKPQGLLEKILCDADLYHFGTDDFFLSDLLVKKEYQLRNNFLPKNWDETTLALLENHKFHTDYCRNFLAEGKKKNIIKLRDKINSRN